MSTTSVTSSQGTTSLINAAISAAQTAASSTSAAATSSSSTSTSSASALASLGTNYNEFLTMLTTQLKNQDPSSPMSTDSFTSELAQFAGVEQQVQTNTNLSSLISLTQDSTLTSGLNLVGKSVSVDSSSLPLQNGSASLTYNAPSAGTVAIAVTDSSGNVVKTQEVDASAGTNTWTWNGENDDGTQLADGQYSVAIEASTASGSTTALTPTVTGTVTGVSNSGSSVDLQMGSVSTSINNLVST
jgi:flagellar basal-body rod modification protein FlgD